MYIVVIPQNKKSHFAVYKTSGQMTYIYGFMMQEMLIAFELNNKMHILHLFFSYLHCELNFRAHIAVNLCYVLTNFAYNNIYNNTNDYTGNMYSANSLQLVDCDLLQ